MNPLYFGRKVSWLNTLHGDPGVVKIWEWKSFENPQQGTLCLKKKKLKKINIVHEITTNKTKTEH